jgi:hypothetical protein
VRARQFVYPILPAPRVAVLIPGFRSKGCVRVFPDGWTDETAKFAPQSIAGRYEQIEALQGIATPTHAVIVIRREWEPGVSSIDRERIWRAFRVPIFEQIVAEDGSLLAAECEAHDGLHIASRKFTVGDHEVERNRCGCGNKSPRLMQREVLHTVAAAGN